MDIYKYANNLRKELEIELLSIDYLSKYYDIKVECINYPIFDLIIFTKEGLNYKGYLLRFITQSDLKEDISYIKWYFKNKQDKELSNL